MLNASPTCCLKFPGVSVLPYITVLQKGTTQPSAGRAVPTHVEAANPDLSISQHAACRCAFRRNKTPLLHPEAHHRGSCSAMRQAAERRQPRRCRRGIAAIGIKLLPQRRLYRFLEKSHCHSAAAGQHQFCSHLWQQEWRHWHHGRGGMQPQVLPAGCSGRCC